MPQERQRVQQLVPLGGPLAELEEEQNCCAVRGVHELYRAFEAALAKNPSINGKAFLVKGYLPSVICLPD